MMKVLFKVGRNFVNVSKFGSSPQHDFINTTRIASFSYVSHNNEHNVGAPPPRSPPKVHLTVDDPRDNLNIKKNREHDDIRERTEDVTEKAKRGTKGVVETALNAGAAVAEGMEKSWGGIKETTEKIKDSVLGDDDENNEKRYGDNMRGSDQGYVDKNIEDLRRKAGGYDQRRSP
ncbi:uncharacterized protein LOC141646987 [Silene latifolia]|uniref:uncharacterized protein LOC141646987 n=1 Tax=Silene latifolia TaxID=37657 RepID=UPI003D776CEA